MDSASKGVGYLLKPIVKIRQFTLYVCIDRLTLPSKKQGKFNAPILSRTFPI